MAYEEDFVSEKLIDFEIDGRPFKLKELNGKENDEAMDKYVSVTEDNKIVMSIAKRNEIWLKKCVIDAPYEKDGKPFKQLSNSEQIEILNKLKAKIRNKILKKLVEMNTPEENVIKK